MRNVHPIVGALIGIFFISIAVLLAMSTDLTPEQQKWTVAPGMVTRVSRSSKFTSEETIQYEVSGKTYTTQDYVSFGWPNHEVTVRYDPKSPDSARRQPDWSTALLGAPVLLGLIGIAFAFGAYRNWNLMRDGALQVSKFSTALWLLVVAFLGCTLVSFNVFTAQNHAREAVAKTWPTVLGKITSSNLVNDARANTSTANVEYKFTVGGKEFTGTKFGLSGGFRSKTDPDMVAQVVQDFPVGKVVPVYYNPGDPSEAVLEPTLYWAPKKQGIATNLRGFGTFDKYGQFRRVTNEIPDIIYEGYGWRLSVDKSKPTVHWKEEVTLPAAPRYFSANEKGIKQTVSPDWHHCTSEADFATTKGYIQHYWTIAPNDPKGPYNDDGADRRQAGAIIPLHGEITAAHRDSLDRLATGVPTGRNLGDVIAQVLDRKQKRILVCRNRSDLEHCTFAPELCCTNFVHSARLVQASCCIVFARSDSPAACCCSRCAHWEFHLLAVATCCLLADR